MAVARVQGRHRPRRANGVPMLKESGVRSSFMGCFPVGNAVWLHMASSGAMRTAD